MFLCFATGISAATKTYMLKTSGTIDTSKGYLVVYQDGTSASIMKGDFTKRDENPDVGAILDTTATITNNVISVDNKYAVTFVSTSETGKYYLKSSAGSYYMGTDGSQQWLQVSSTGMYNTVSFDGGKVKVVSTYNTALLGYDSNAGGKIEGFYYTPNGTTSNIYLYEEFSNYAVSCLQTTGGTVSASVSSAAANTSVTLTAVADAHYTFNGFTVTDGSGNPVSVTTNGNQGTFTMQSSNVTVTGSFVRENVTYTINIEGVPEGKSASVTYKNQEYTSGKTITTNEELSESDFTPSEIQGYTAFVSVSESAVTVTYKKNVEITYSSSFSGATWYAWKVGDKYIQYNSSATEDNGGKSSTSTVTSPTSSDLQDGGQKLTSSIDYANIDQYLWAFVQNEDKTVAIFNQTEASFSNALYSGTKPGTINDWLSTETTQGYTYLPYFTTKGTTHELQSGTEADGTAWKLADNYDGATFKLSTINYWSSGYGTYLCDYGVDKLVMCENEKTVGSLSFVSATMSLEEFAKYTVSVTGCTDANAGVTFQNQNYTSDFYAPTTLTADQLTGITVDGYEAPTVSLSGTTVTVTYKQITYAITKGTHKNGDFTISPDGSQPKGTEVTLTATGNDGYAFSSWNVYKTGDSVSTVTVTDNKFTMPEYPVTVDATFKIKSTEYVYQVTGIDSKNYVSSWISSVTSPTTLKMTAYNYTDKTDILNNLKQENGEGTFSAYSGNSNHNYCSCAYEFTVGTGYRVSAMSFTYTTKTGSPTLTLLGESTTTTSPVSVTYEEDGSQSGFIVSSSTSNAQAAVTISGCTVTVVPQEYTIEYVLDGGTDPGNPENYTYETETFNLLPPTKDGYTFLGWTYDGQTTPTTNVTIVKGSKVNYKFTAKWEKISDYTITCNEMTNGTVSSDHQTANANTEVILTINPDSGYEYKESSLKVTNASQQTVKTTEVTSKQTYKFTMPASNVTVYAEFTAMPTYTITCTSDGNGTVSADYAETYNDNQVTVSIFPHNGYKLSTLKYNDTDVTSSVKSNKYIFTMPSSAVTITATFEASSTARTYVLKTSGDIDTNKTYLIVYQEGKDATTGKVMDSSFTSNTSNSKQGASPLDSDVDISSHTIFADNTNAFTFTGSAGSYYIKNYSNYYFYNTSTSGSEYFAVSTTQPSSTNAVSFVSATGEVIITSSVDSRYLQYNTADNLFRYSGGSGIYLYEESTTKQEQSEDGTYTEVSGSPVTDEDVQSAINAMSNTNGLVYVNDPTYTNSTDMKNVIVNIGTTENPVYKCSNFVLEDKVDFSCPIGFTSTKTDKAIYTRSVTSNWGTICLPYVPTAKEGVTYYELTAANVDNTTENGTLTFTAVSNPQANTPYVFKIGTTEYSNTGAVQVVATPDKKLESTSDVSWTLIGTYKNETITDPNTYYIKYNKFWSINGNFKISAFRAYFSVSSSGAKASSFSIEENNEIIDSLNTLTNSEDEVEGYYNINGIKQNDVQKGLNIIKFKSGKTVKVMIK